MMMMMVVIENISDEEEGNKHQLISPIFDQLTGEQRSLPSTKSWCQSPHRFRSIRNLQETSALLTSAHSLPVRQEVTPAT